jgi:lipoprotein-anchoring transpeptidase ErfK/SrfK
MTEWPSWTPTPELKKRIAVPNYVSPVAENPIAARAMYRTRARGHPVPHSQHQSAEYIDSAISSGCIRLTNEDVIDLYNRGKVGTTVVVLKSTGDPSYSSASNKN